MKKDDGFTFVETLAVLAIMLILAAGVGIAADRYIRKARVVAARSQIEVYALALQSYYMDCGMYPSEEQGLEALWKKPDFFPVPQNWDGPYVDREIQADPWGNAYVYSRLVQVGVPFEITSLGSDGCEGGEGDAADIVSWK